MAERPRIGVRRHSPVRPAGRQRQRHRPGGHVGSGGRAVRLRPLRSVTVLSASWASTTDSYSWQYLFQGGRLDFSSGLYHFGARDYSVTLQRWVQSDPAGYVDGANTYQFVRSSPADQTDAAGLCAESNGWKKKLSAAAKIAGGLVEAVIGVGTLETGVGVIPLLHGLDTMLAGARELAGEKNVQTLTAQAISAVASDLGASDGTARTIGNVGDIVVGLVGTIGAGALSSTAKAVAVAAAAGDGADAAAAAARLTEMLGDAAPQAMDAEAVAQRLAAVVDDTEAAAKAAPSMEELSDAASAMDRGGLTASGRSLTKHGAGARPGNSLFPSAQGNPTTINQTAKDIVDDILNHPETTIQNSYRGRFGNTIEVNASDGRGLVFDANGKFLFFKEN